MSEIWSFIETNCEWLFSGLGIFVISLIIAFYRFRKKETSGDTIITKGDQSPGKVGGNYKVENYARNKD